ncbi:hypothetical protein E1262_22180 [Jiangella aurantiaca]|uniref:PRC-barrel domain containing protein n=1 Tax=Jiangella aurantiaca TaxID=2530373 RepID=A0A4R5A6M4_9ACTN|nr:hypothetical protein [Jiangella aurantiaca]TDD66459.1 hypothetical protein E1262_22180 [Jiangella aurantiaca]
MTNGNDAADRLGDVREGMTVVDALGEELGPVAEVKLGDPEAVTTAGQEPAPGGDDLVGTAARAIWSGPDLPEQEIARFRRVGYLRVDRAMARDLYAAADDVHRVDGEMVRLSVPADQLVSG